MFYKLPQSNIEYDQTLIQTSIHGFNLGVYSPEVTNVKWGSLSVTHFLKHDSFFWIKA